jgi:hypothetical protein
MIGGGNDKACSNQPFGQPRLIAGISKHPMRQNDKRV